MDPRVIALHDEALRLKPEASSHDESICPICTDWSLDEAGLPTGFERLDEAVKQAPFGDVDYADPGLLEDGVKRFPLDTETHIEAALSALESPMDERYSPDDVQQMRQRAQSAAERIGAKPQEAASDKAQREEGGSTPMADEKTTITQETHEALLRKAVDDATEAARVEIAQLKEQVEETSSQFEAASARVTELEEANEKANADLDAAQVELNAAKEENAQLKEDIAQRDTEAEMAKLAGERAEQVRNLGLFTDDQIKDKARAWAEIPEDDWASRVEEWREIKGESPATPATTAPQDTAMSGSTPEPEGKPTSPRRAVLGLS